MLVGLQSRLPFVLSRRCPLSIVSYHVSASLQCSGDSRVRVRPLVKRPRTRILNTNPAVSEGWQQQRRTPETDAWENKILESDPRRGDHQRVSSELRKLILDDFPAEREVRQGTTTRDSGTAEDYEVVYGVSPCLLALTQGRRRLRKLFVKDGATSDRASVLQVCEEAHRRGVQVQRVSKRDLDKMSAAKVHQGVCLQASPLSYLTEKRDSTQRMKERGTPLWLVLEGVQDPMNLGAILRSAYFLGVDRVASSLHYSCPLSPVVSKASSGVMEVFGVYGYEDLEDMLRSKAAQGWQVVGTVGAEAEEAHVLVTQCSDFRLTKPTLLLMGGEGGGLSRGLLSLCHTLVTIPPGRDLFPGVESLNVSVAAGILLHALLQSRR